MLRLNIASTVTVVAAVHLGCSPVSPNLVPPKFSYLISGVIYDKKLEPITSQAELLVLSKGNSVKVLKSVQIEDGRFSFEVTSSDSFTLAVTARGFGTRTRDYSLRRYSNYSLSQGISGTSKPIEAEVNFGGPVTSNDPDAGAYFLPPFQQGSTPAVLLESANLENARHSTVAMFDSGPSAQGPRGIAYGSSGVLYVAGWPDNSLYEVSPTGLISWLAGAPHLGYSGNPLLDGAGTDSQFYEPTDLAVDQERNVFVADAGNNAIRQVAADGQVTTVAGARGAGYKDGPSPEARFFRPESIALDGAGNLIVADTGNNCVRRISPDGMVTTVAGHPEPGYANGSGSSVRFRQPRRLSIDGSDNIYVLDAGNYRIRKISPEGDVTTYFGDLANSETGDVLVPPVCDLGDLAVTDSGTVLVTGNNNEMRGVPPRQIFLIYQNREVKSLAISRNNDASISNATYNLSGICTNGKGTLWVGDMQNSCIRQLDFEDFQR